MKWFDFMKGFVIRDGVLLAYKGKKSRVVIPDTVTAIGMGAFYCNNKLVEVVIPEGVTEIRDEAFSYCRKLETVHIPAGVKVIGESAFKSCNNLRKIALPDIEKIHYAAFHKCENLEEVILPDSEILVASLAFAGCPKLADNEGFIILKKFLFDYIGEAAHITIPDGVRVIGSEAIAWHDCFETVVCPDSVEVVLPYAFCGCYNMISVTIPNKMAQIREEAFLNCGRKTRICAPEGSEAQRYVEENSITFIAI